MKKMEFAVMATTTGGGDVDCGITAGLHVVGSALTFVALISNPFSIVAGAAFAVAYSGSMYNVLKSCGLVNT